MRPSLALLAAIILGFGGVSARAAVAGSVPDAAGAFVAPDPAAAAGVAAYSPTASVGASNPALVPLSGSFLLSTPADAVSAALLPAATRPSLPARAAASEFPKALAPRAAVGRSGHGHNHDGVRLLGQEAEGRVRRVTDSEAAAPESRAAADARYFDQTPVRTAGGDPVFSAAGAAPGKSTAFGRASTLLGRAVRGLLHEHHHDDVPSPDDEDFHEHGEHGDHGEHAAKPIALGALSGSIVFGLGLAAAEYAGGALTGAVALQADALHIASDRVMDAAALASIRFGGRGAAARSIEAGVGLASAAALAAVGLFEMLPHAISGFLHPAVLSGWSVAGFAALSLLSNAVSAVILSRRRDGHLALRGAFLHASIDAFGALGIVVAAAASVLLGWNYALPAVSALLVLVLLRAAWSLARSALHLASRT